MNKGFKFLDAIAIIILVLISILLFFDLMSTRIFYKQVNYAVVIILNIVIIALHIKGFYID